MYNTQIREIKQRDHILGTDEFKRRLIAGVAALGKNPPINRMPSYLNNGEDAQKLVDEYKDMGIVQMHPSSIMYPRQDIKANRVIGKYFDLVDKKWLETGTFTMIYSSKGVHIYPIKPY
ncbi:MAG: polymorphic toxin type 50 domain-containing protein [Turicibacter sp.]|nr:polymorphic toxin type 50 domain-containing protein [Turicibacter sp.]